MSNATKTAETDTQNELSAAEAVATMCLFRTADQTAFKRDLPAGEYEIDTVIRIFGSIHKEPPKTGVIAQKASPWKLFAAALSKLNATTIASIVRDAEKITAQEEEDLKSQVQEALVAIKGTITGTISGRTMPSLQWERVG